MQLKNYQQKAIDDLDRWLDALKSAREEIADAEEFYAQKKKPVPDELKNYPSAAWQILKDQGNLPSIEKDGKTEAPDYISRTATSGAPIPHVCLKVPTGGGKTLLGAVALERIKLDTGFVLWIVPTRAIYDQTIKAFRTREHPYRQMLERISGGRVKLLQKADHFTKQDIESQLCVMMLMLPSANRQKGRGFLKIFRDSGSYTSFFPEQDDKSANEILSEQHPDLEKNKTEDWVKQSLINVFKLIRPTVILDEAHKAYGPNNKNNQEFVKSVNRLNPRLVLELSATPKTGISNILVNISGTKLRDEEMIKLPIEIHSSRDSDWQHTLAETQARLNELENAAQKSKQNENRYVRPIALVRVQNTGKEQRKQGRIHSEDVREYLIQNLSVPENQIRIQSSEQKELAGEDLLSELSSVRWIITKDALKEGWDCAFAYVLALLDNTTATTAITQMVGRVMRQPQARRMTNNEALNRCYIYCYNKEVGNAVDSVKAGLENEGLTGLGDSVLGYGEGDAPKPVTIKRRASYKELEIFLPQILHKQKRGWRPIDYDRDILSAIDWNAINVGEAVSLSDQDIAQEEIVTVDLEGQGELSQENLDTGEGITLDYFARYLDMIPNPWQAAHAAERFLKKHKRKQHSDAQLLKHRLDLAKELRRRINVDIDAKAEAVFRHKVGKNEIRFHLETDKQLSYEIEKSLKVFVGDEDEALQNKAQSVQHSLFETVYKKDFNDLEKNFALYLEKSNKIHWWHRIAARQAYSLQGWQRHRVYPDFVACKQNDGTLLIVEIKGKHLQGNEDTEYKKKLLDILEDTYRTALDRGTMEVREPRAQFKMMFEDTWKEQMDSLVE